MSSSEILNRGAAIEFLQSVYPYPDEPRILTELPVALDGVGRLAWLFRAQGVPLGIEEEDHHWLISDATIITTDVHRPSLEAAYKEQVLESRRNVET